jgi:hypothetical protein
VAVVETIRGLLAIGIPTALVRSVLPCTVGERTDDACPGLLAQVAGLRDDIREKACRLGEIEGSLTAYLRDNG